MALTSRPHQVQEDLIQALKNGDATPEEQQAAAEHLESEIKRADDNAASNRGLNQQITGMCRVIELYAAAGK